MSGHQIFQVRFKRLHSRSLCYRKGTGDVKKPQVSLSGSPFFMNTTASLPGKSFVWREKTLNSGSQATSCSPRAWPSVRPTAGAQQTLGGLHPQLPREPSLLSCCPARSCTTQTRRAARLADCEAHGPPPPHPADPPGAPRRRRHPSKPQPAAQSFRLGLLGYRVTSVSIATRRLGTMAVGPQRAQGSPLE